MATITSANVQAITDSIAKHIADLQTLVGGSQTTLAAGKTTTLGKVAALNDASQLYALMDGFQQAFNAESAFLTQLTSYNAILDLFAPACIALEKATGGLAAFLAANSLQVAPGYLDAHNRCQARTGAVLALPNYSAFGPVGANLGQITLTGAGAGTFAAGTSEPATYGNAPLSIFNNKGSTGGAASATYTVTYNAYNSSGVLQTGLTATATMPASATNGQAVSLGVSGVAVTNITVVGGTAADVVAVSAAALRAVAY